MRRRAFVTLLGGAAAWPLSARAQHYEHACAVLGLADRLDPLTEIIAKKIIERAKDGELDTIRLCEAVLEELRDKG